MSNLLFDDVRQWRICLWSGVCKAAWGVYRILTCILFGIASVFVWIGKQIGAFCKREFLASLIIGTLIALICVGWFGTFVMERAARVDAEMQRDKLRYELDSTKQLLPSYNHQNNDSN
jgi:hypothetical protein